jgi:hypothetical protein
MSDLSAFSRRQFLAQASYFGAIYSLASALPFPALASSLRDDSWGLCIRPTITKLYAEWQRK